MPVRTLQACPASLTCLPNSEYSATFKKIVPARDERNVVSRLDTTSDKYSCVSCETASQQSYPHDTERCPFRRSVKSSEVRSEPVLWAPKPTSLEILTCVKRDTASHVSDCDNGSDVLRYVP
jgi:hypothetical protein